MTNIRTTVPALPKGMGKKKGCEECGKGGKLAFSAETRRWLCACCKGGRLDKVPGGPLA